MSSQNAVVRSPGRQVADGLATVVIGPGIVIVAETRPRFRCNLSPYSTVPLGPLRARRSPTTTSGAGIAGPLIVPVTALAARRGDDADALDRELGSRRSMSAASPRGRHHDHRA